MINISKISLVLFSIILVGLQNQNAHAKPCGGGFFSKVGCAIDPTNPESNGGKTQKIDPTKNIPGSKYVAEQAWGEAGGSAYPSAASIMRGRHGNSVGLDDIQQKFLRPHYGNLVDQAVVVYNAKMMSEWTALGKKIDLGGTESAAQTYCNRIYVSGSYQKGDRDQLLLLAHELRHSQQCQELGGAGKFGFHYFREYKRAGLSYENNELEKSARQLANTIANALPNDLSQPNNRFRPGFYSRVGMNPPGIIYLWPSPWNAGKDDVWCDVPNHDMYVRNLNGIGSAIEVNSLKTIEDSAKYWSQPCSDDVFKQSRDQH